MEMPETTNSTPSVKAAKPIPSKYRYIGPDYTTAIMRVGIVFQPKTMSDGSIETLLAIYTWAEEWFIKA